MPVTVPTLTVEVVDGYVTVEVADYGSATSWTLYRSNDYDDSAVRGVIGQALPTVDTAIDIDFPQNTPFVYYAEVTDGTDTEYSLESAAFDIDLGHDLLIPAKPVADATAVTVVEMGEAAWGQRAEVVSVAGRADPVVVADTAVLPQFDLTVLAPDRAVRDWLMRRLEETPICCFSPRYPTRAFADGKPIHIAVTSRSESLFGAPSDGARLVKLTCQRIGVPKLPLVLGAGPGWVYTGV